MPGTLFSLDVKELTSLSAEFAVDFFRRLLWAEARTVGVSRHLVDAPQCINVGDGGLDALIRDASPSDDSLIPAGTSGFQIKATDMGPAECRRELHHREDLTEPLKPGVKGVMDADGTYVLVLFRELTADRKEERQQAIQDELSKAGYPTAKVRFYTASQVVGFAEQYLSLVAWLRPATIQCLSYAAWAGRSDVTAPKTFVLDDDRRKWMEDIRATLRAEGDGPKVCRVSGLSGIGKTRFVFECVGADDLKNQVIYVQADAFRQSGLLQKLESDSSVSAIIVVDECDLSQHDELVRALGQRAPRLALITMSYDNGRVPPPAKSYDLQPLASECISSILETDFAGLPSGAIPRLTEFAGGYPRIAVLLAESYLATGDTDSLLTVSDIALMNHLIGGRLNPDSDEFRRVASVLRWLSLFQKVGYEGQVAAEAQWLAGKAGVGWPDFQQVVANQRARGIIQGVRYVYVTSFMLRIHLIREWWDIHGMSHAAFDTFAQDIPQEFREDLFQRFIEHVPYIGDTQRGKAFIEGMLGWSSAIPNAYRAAPQHVVSFLFHPPYAVRRPKNSTAPGSMSVPQFSKGRKYRLGPTGPFGDGDLLRSELGARFFHALAEADPEAAVTCLSRTVGSWSKEQLLAFADSRQHVVWALEGIAMHRNLFAAAARILLALGEAETATHSNNASGVFAGLFSLAYGPVAPTGAPPEERLPVLREPLESPSPERRRLGIQACSAALNVFGGIRVIGAEYQGLHRVPEQWTPQTWGEIFDAMRKVWTILMETLESFPAEEERAEAVKVLLASARGVSRYDALRPMVIESLRQLNGRPYVERAALIKTAVQILHYDHEHLSDEGRSQWQALRDELTGSDFSDRLYRYVGMTLVEDHFDERGQRTKASEAILEDLAREAARNPELLTRELEWLDTPRAENGFLFGYALGKQDQGFSLLHTLLDAQQAAGNKGILFFLGGYCRSLAEIDPVRWAALLDELGGDPLRCTWVPELTWRSGRVTDDDARRVLELARRGRVGSEALRVFVFGRTLEAVSDEVIHDWFRYLLDVGDIAALSTAIDLFHMRYVYGTRQADMPRDLAAQLLTHPAWFTPASGRGDLDETNWTDVALAMIRRHPESSDALLDRILDQFGETGTIVGGFFPKARQVLNAIMGKNPVLVWRRVRDRLGPPIDGRAWHLKEWLRGGGGFIGGDEAGGPLDLVPSEEIWQWVDERPDERAWYLASFVPKVFTREPGRRCLAREVLIRYGDRDEVRSSLGANFGTEGWTGPGSMHHEWRKAEVMRLLAEEPDQNVRRWLQERAAQIDRDIDYFSLLEEREKR